MDTVPVWVNLLNPVRRLTNSADCNQHQARLCANGRFWRKAAIREEALFMPLTGAGSSFTYGECLAGRGHRSTLFASTRSIVEDVVDETHD